MKIMAAHRIDLFAAKLIALILFASLSQHTSPTCAAEEQAAIREPEQGSVGWQTDVPEPEQGAAGGQIGVQEPEQGSVGGQEAREEPKKDLPYQLDLARSYLRNTVLDPDSSFYFDNAVTQYNEILKTYPNNREALAGLAELYFVTGDTATAEEFFQRLEKIDPAYAASQKNRITAKPAPEKKKKKKKKQRKAEYVEDRLALARSYMKQSKADPEEARYINSAITAYEDALKMAPDDKEALTELAILYAENGSPAKAEGLLKKLAESEPMNLAHRLNLAILYLKIGSTSKAHVELDKVLAAFPNNGRAHLLRGAIYDRDLNPARAIAEYAAALAIAESTHDLELAVRAHFQLGYTYDKARLFSRAVGEFEKIIRMKPDLKEGYLELARIAYRLGLTDKTISTLNALLKESADVPQAYEMLGMAYLRKGYYETSLRYFRLAKDRGVPVNDKAIAAIEQQVAETREGGVAGE